jgi:C1A family cysteine protease
MIRNMTYRLMLWNAPTCMMSIRKFYVVGVWIMSLRFKFILASAMVIVLMISSIAGVGAGAATNNQQGMGLKEPTSAQIRWINQNFPVISQFRLNSIALERINAERAQQGKEQLDPQSLSLAPIGQEAVFAGGSGLTGNFNAISALPSAADNSASPAFPPIRSQGGIGSCAAWASTYYQFTYETNLARGRTASGGNNAVIFSPKFTYNLINGGQDGGSYFSDCFAVEMKNGGANWAAFPYDTNYLAWPTDGPVWRDALNYRAQTYGQLSNSNTELLIQDVKTQLANGHVLVIATYVLSWVQKTVSNDPSTDADNAYVNQKIASYCSNTNSGGHGMTIVGFNDNIWCDLNSNGVVDSGEKGAFKIANSWGTGDWNAGYRWVSYDALRAVSLAPQTSNWPPANRSPNGIFWKGNIFTLTARPSYTPTMVAQVTLNSAKRGQINFTLGTGTLTSTVPAAKWSSKALNYTGGNYGFSGTATPCNGTFYFDFSELNTGATTNQRWFAGVYDSTAGSAAVLSSYKLYTVGNGVDTLVGSGQSLPLSADAGQVYSWAEYVPGGINYPPVASFTVTPASGSIPLPVSFNASASSDPDGQISTYAWNFGDGTSGSGVSASHTYTLAKTYTAILTVTDNKGAAATSSKTITTVDTNLINSPTRLAGRVTGKVVTLSWRDNSNNESGFYIERGVRNATGYTYTRLTTLAGNATSYTFTSLSGTYAYRVQAFNQTTGRASGYSNVITVRVR